MFICTKKLGDVNFKGLSIFQWKQTNLPCNDFIQMQTKVAILLLPFQ